MKRSILLTLMAASLLIGTTAAVPAVPSLIEEVRDGIYVVRDDGGQFGGWSLGVTHMLRPQYKAKKILDLSQLPADEWTKIKEVRLSLAISVRDYSAQENPPTNGLDEAFEVTINGHRHHFPTNCGAPVYAEGKPNDLDWFDFSLPKEQVVRGVNEIIIHKAEGPKYDDYLYLGIDNSQQRGNSLVAFEGDDWTRQKLTIPGGNGEYMVRLYLLSDELSFRLSYTPGQQPSLDDPGHLVTYVGARGAQRDEGGITLQKGQSLRLEWRPGDLDRSEPLQVQVAMTGTGQVAVLDAADKPQQPVQGPGPITLDLPGEAGFNTSGVIITATDQPVVVTRVSLTGARSYHPAPRPRYMVPTISPPACGPRLPTTDQISCQVAGRQVTLTNGQLRCHFDAGPRLKLTSLYNAITKTEMVRQPDASGLFTVMVGDERFTGSGDFHLKGLQPTKTGFSAQLALAKPLLQAELLVKMEREGLRLGLKLVNGDPATVDFKLAFPHLAGLAVSPEPEWDYYFYPWGGGIISDQPALIRRGYGDHEAIYQVMDLFSPSQGGGLYLRLDDREGWHKILSLRKHVPDEPEFGGDRADGVNLRVKAEYRIPSQLDRVAGIGLSADYLRRTRPPGGSFVPAEAVLGAHSGDWHEAMKSYADWAHQVWQWRPYPSRLHTVRNMIAAGWGQSFLYKDGQYRTDFIQKPNAAIGPTMTNCIELMSWWDWSPLGPFMTPFDKLDEVLTPAQINSWASYFVIDPVTGQKMWNNQPGDYAGYNERFGGLPAFREAVQTYQNMGALTTLYTDPFRLDENCPTGQAHGKAWCVVDQSDQLSTGYEVYNPCHDLPAVRQWVAQTMGRVMRETGADGLRLDEYGHRGWACYNPDHQHTYQESGITQWQKATAETVRMVHEEMDKVRPDLVLTTEHPGYDYMMQYLEGCITYDLTVQATPLRPLECNLQRFYFPECKAYELDHQGADLQDRKKFWNAVESFGRYYPVPYYVILSQNEAAYQGRQVTPLLDTPGKALQVYINRFAASGKTLYHLYNASGSTHDGVAMAIPVDDQQHLYDLLSCEEPATNKMPGRSETYVHLYIPRSDVTCVGVFPRFIEARREGDIVTVSHQVPAVPQGGLNWVVASREGYNLLVQNAAQANATLDLTRLTDEGQPACIKLLDGEGQLLDVVSIP